MALRQRVLSRRILTGEATTYMPYLRVPGWLRQVRPNLKLIFFLRDPVDRAFSHYMHNRRGFPGLEPLSFSDAIRAERERIAPDIEALERDEWHDDLNYRVYSCVHSGMYAVHLKNWLRSFPRERIFVAESERFFSDPQQVMGDITRFLELPDHAYDCSQKLNTGAYTENVSAADRRYLHGAFADDCRELRKLLGAEFGALWTC